MTKEVQNNPGFDQPNSNQDNNNNDSQSSMSDTKNELNNANSEQGMKSLPDFVNLDKWEDAGYEWSGNITPKLLPRVIPMVPSDYQDQPIALTCHLKKDGQLLKLVLNFSGEVWTMCQRCLQPVSVDVTHQSKLILLQHEDQESLVDDDDDYLLLDELLTSQAESKKGQRLLPLSKLVEDELLLEIPLSAKHEDCEMAVQQVGDIVEEEAENPFAVLESLKGKLG